MKKHCLNIFAVLLAAALLQSCVSINRPHVTTEPESEVVTAPESDSETGYDYDIVENDFYKEMTRYLNMSGSADFGGAYVMIAAPSSSLIDGEGSGEALSRDIELRNSFVEENLNVKLTSKIVPADELLDALDSAEAADEFFADILLIPQRDVYKYAASGLLMNLNSLPFADFESGYNISSAVGAAMAGGTGWAVAGWATLDADSLPALFFNKDLVKSAGLDDPYDLVNRGEWTWEKFFEYTSAVAAMNDERAASGDPLLYTYGTQSYAISLADVVYFSCGNKFVSSGLGNYPAIAMDRDSLAPTMQIETALFNDPYKIQNSFEALNVFASGGAMFLIDRLGTMKAIANTETVWGVLPMPKKDAAQESYASLVPSDSLMFAVPAGSTGAEKVSRVIADMNICSLGSLVDSYLTDCMYYYLRDNDSIASVEKICYGAVWDMAYTTDGYDAFIPNATYFAVRDVYENGHDIERFINDFAPGAAAALYRLFP